jgi:hypothetical protein
VGVNVIGGSKKINVRANIKPQKAAEPFSNGFLKKPLLNGSAGFWCYESLF